MQSALLLLLLAVLAVCLLQWSNSHEVVHMTADDELSQLRYANDLLRGKLKLYEEQQEIRRGQQLHRSSHLESRIGSSASASVLLDAHRIWDWKSIVNDFLRPWPTIASQQLDAAVAACNGSAMYCQRFQIYQGRAYITDYAAIFFDRHYAPARVLPLLDTLRRHPNLPDLDIVVAGVDEPRVHNVPGDTRAWSRMCSAHCLPAGRLPPAIFSSTTNGASLDLPWLDFAWHFPRRPHKLRTPPWSVLHPQLMTAGGKVAWGEKIELAMHTGNVGSPSRKLLSQVAKVSPGEVLVNELFIGDHAKIQNRCVELGLERAGGFQQHKCFMTFEDQCSYKYLLNSASIGYANKFKSLLLCGSVVIYVRDGMRHKEFYEYGLLPGVHYVAVDRVHHVPAMVRWLRQNDDYARAVAQAGRARMSSLDAGGLSDFMAELLRQYARRLRFHVRPQPGAVLVECEDDLWRHYALSRPWLDAYLTQDNSTCVHPPRSGELLHGPGWGGAYRGSKPRCYASHDRSPGAQPHACDWNKPYATSESWEPDGTFPKPHPSNRDGWEKH